MLLYIVTYLCSVIQVHSADFVNVQRLCHYGIEHAFEDLTEIFLIGGTKYFLKFISPTLYHKPGKILFSEHNLAFKFVKLILVSNQNLRRWKYFGLKQRL